MEQLEIKTQGINEAEFTMSGCHFTMSRPNESEDWVLLMGSGPYHTQRIVREDSANSDYYGTPEGVLSVFAEDLKDYLAASFSVERDGDEITITVNAGSEQASCAIPLAKTNYAGDLTFRAALESRGVIVPEAMIDEIDEKCEPYYDEYLESQE